ncbi:hypothetical protein DM02DRAFT_729185 [Periconia macrospinosa]|uniref:Protection of telomeres protein 1 ssDNA-binding domain-containing protein n=1 Tax=Periconia macrospinosa TaxID=97972 RepID=A0A2V1DNB1_9PLEO|nr:hypothetical protein DM02DRAFT_729185 [Periconia macrospinosa]
MSNLASFSPIREAEDAPDGSSFLGVIVEIKSPFTTIQKDSRPVVSLEFTIQDQFSVILDPRSRLKCRLNRDSEERLPKGSVGDIALLKRMRIISTNGNVVASNAGRLSSEAAFFPDRHIPKPHMSTAYAPGGSSTLKFEAMVDSQPPSPAEQLAIIGMKATAANFLPMILQQSSTGLPPVARYNQSPRNPSNSSRNSFTPVKSSYTLKKQALIKDILSDKFYDLTGEVVKMFYTHNSMDLYITDYTENKHLFPYADPNDPDVIGITATNWRGPYGQVTLMVRLWDSHAILAREVINEGDIAYLQNVRIKWAPDGRLEGSMHGDSRFPNKKFVHKCVDPVQVNSVLQRKMAYEGKHEQPSTYHVPCNAPQHVPQNVPQNVPKNRSGKAKRAEKKERDRLQRELEQEELQEKLTKEERERAGLNNDVRSGHSTFQLSTVREIINNPARRTTTEDGLPLTLPFINCRYRAHLRVVDFWPMTLAQFSRSMGDATFNTKATDEQRRKSERKFEWNFVLLVEDAASPARSDKERIPLVFGNLQGQNLLKIDAGDLRKDERTLQKLEEILFILWGNLYERKVALWKEKKIRLPLPSDDPQLRLQNRPFECCLEEYGEAIGAHAEADHWVRRFSPFNTTIMSKWNT